jgi:hypothetical protein
MMKLSLRLGRTAECRGLGYIPDESQRELYVLDTEAGKLHVSKVPIPSLLWNELR